MNIAPRIDEAGVLFGADDLPVLQNRVYPTEREAIDCPKGRMRLVQDAASGIVCNAAFEPDSIVYDESYQNEQGCSSAFQKHLRDVSGVLRRHFDGMSLLEVGCGKGLFLEMLRAEGIDVIGVDPAYEGNASHVIRQRFSPSLGITRDAIVLRHVLEHIPDPLRFLASIAEANGGRGLIYIEVPSFDWIRENRAWFDVFYEHVNYFREADFRRMFGTVLESGALFGGQYLYVVADLATLGAKLQSSDPVTLPAGFLDGIERARRIVTSNPSRRHVVWGASSKGVLFSLHLARHGARLNFAIDINPAKQGRHMPATGLGIFSPEAGLSLLSPGDGIFVMNPNYAQEIRDLAGPSFEYYLPE